MQVALKGMGRDFTFFGHADTQSHHAHAHARPRTAAAGLRESFFNPFDEKNSKTLMPESLLRLPDRTVSPCMARSASGVLVSESGVSTTATRASYPIPPAPPTLKVEIILFNVTTCPVSGHGRPSPASLRFAE